MPSKTPRKNMSLRSRSPISPKSPGWVSGKDAIFISPKSLSPKKPNTRRTSVYQKMKSTSPGFNFKVPITQMLSPKGVQTRSRRSSMFGVFKKGGVRLIDIPITPDSKKPSPLKTRSRRSSIYQKDVKREVQQKTHRRTSVYQATQDIQTKPTGLPKQTKKKVTAIKTQARKTRERIPSETEVFINPRKPVVHSPVVSLVDVISPSKEPSQYITLNIKSSVKSPSAEVVKNKTRKTPSTSKKSQGKRKIEQSVSDDTVITFKTPVVTKKSPTGRSTKSDDTVITFKTPVVTKKSPTGRAINSARQSTRKMSARKTGQKENASETTVRHNETEESMLINFKTPGLSVKKSARKRKAVEQISPPAKKCILDLSPVEKLPFKTPYKLDKSPVLILQRTPLADVFTSTPRESSRARKMPPVSGTSTGKKNLKQSRQSLSKTKKVSIVSDLKTPDYNRPSLISRRKGTPAKVTVENMEDSMYLTSLGDTNVKNITRGSVKSQESENVGSSNTEEPLNVTLLSDQSSNAVVTSNTTMNVTSHSSAGRCTIL